MGYCLSDTFINIATPCQLSIVIDDHHYNYVFLFNLFTNFSWYVGDAGNTSLVDAGTPLGETTVVTPGSAGYLLWECCILASL